MKQVFEIGLHLAPETDWDLYQCASFLNELGYNGIGIMNHHPFVNEEDISFEGVHIIKGVELKCENARDLHRATKKYRDHVDVLAVHGGIEEVNRLAVSNPLIDMLCHAEEGRTSGLNHILMRFAKENDVAIEFNMCNVLSQRGIKRAQIIRKLRKNLSLARKFGVKTILTSGASKRLGVRAPRDLIALGMAVGFTREEAVTSISHNVEAILW